MRFQANFRYLSCCIATLCCLFCALVAQAAQLDGKALAEKNGCLACHQVDSKTVGPAYKDVAARYKGDKGAAARLFAKVRRGGAGAWGPAPMPAQTIGDAELSQVVQWVLNR